MKKKAAIVTLTVANYGNRLQNLAVQMILENMGYETETLHNPFDPNYSEKSHQLKNKIKMLLFRKKFYAQVSRERAFDAFDERYIKYSKYWMNNPKHIAVLNQKYDFFVCGSDQLWNPTSYNYGANNFAMFASSEKKVTMAPSSGVTEFPKEREHEFAEYLNTFRRISVRESSGAEIVRQLTGKHAYTAIDPTLMISRDQWASVSEKPSWFKDEKYILCYFLGSSYLDKTIKTIAEEHHCRVIDLMDKSNIDYYTTDPSGFLYLVAHSELMITDSFHGSVFSVLFDRPLAVVERKDEFVSMNTRLDNLLGLFGLEDRKFSVLSESDRFMDHDYSIAYKILEKEKKAAYDFLISSFGQEGNIR